MYSLYLKYENTSDPVQCQSDISINYSLIQSTQLHVNDRDIRKIPTKTISVLSKPCIQIGNLTSNFCRLKSEKFITYHNNNLTLIVILKFKKNLKLTLTLTITLKITKIKTKKLNRQLDLNRVDQRTVYPLRHWHTCSDVATIVRFIWHRELPAFKVTKI